MTGDCLFIINGLGMGNSTRCHAIIQSLVERGVRVHVLTSGNGLVYFSNCPEISSLAETKAFFYSTKQGRISGWRTAATVFGLYRLWLQKRRDLDALLKRQPVDVVVTDSEYSTAPARRRGIPIIGLNNSDLVVAEYLKRANPPRAIRSHFWLVEYSDFLFHRYRCDLVISPSPVPGKARHPRIRRVGLILRKSVRELVPATANGFPSPRQMKSVVFMLSGSIFASAVAFGQGKFPFRIDVVGRTGTNVGNVTFHGRLMNNLPFLKQADALVINGGFSAVSEALALRKPTFVIPVPGHAEQYVNAGLVSDLGLGYCVTEAEVVAKLNRLYEMDRWENLPPNSQPIGVDGASEAAEIICEMIARRAPRK